MKNLLFFILVFASIFISLSLCAQERTIKGIVRFERKPVSQATVTVKDTDLTTLTDNMGRYKLTVAKGKTTIIIRKKSLKTKEILLGKSNIVNVEMEPPTTEDMFELSIEDLMNVTVTTASKRKEQISNIPASVELITRAEIETYGYSSLEEIIANTTGYYTLDDLSYTLSLPGVRGFMSQNGTGVIILINGVSQLRKGLESYSLRESNVPVESIERIEIIRGPMSVMYGAGAFYGVINIITGNANAEETEVKATVSLGSLQTKKANLSVSGKEGNMNYTMTAGYNYTYGRNLPLSSLTQNYQEYINSNVPANTDGRLEGWDKYFDMCLNLKSFYCNLTYVEIMQETLGVIPSLGDGNHVENSRVNFMFGFDRWLTDKLNLNASFRYNMLNEWLDANWLKEGYYGKQDLRGSFYETELRINYKPLNKLNFVIGLNQNALLDYFMIWDYTDFGSFYNNHLRELDSHNDINTTSVFSQLEYTLLDKIKLVAGLRLENMSDYDFSQSFGSDTTGNNSNSLRTTLKGTYKSEGISVVPRAALIYYINESNVLKFFYGEANKHPGFDENSQNIKDIARFGNLEDERIKTYEVNYSSTIQSKFNLKASLFHNKLENLISRVWSTEPNGDIISHQENAGTYITYGAELGFSALLTDKLKIKLSASYQKTTDKREGFEKVKVAYSPDFLGYASLSYKIGNYYFALTGNYVDEMETFWDGQAPNSEKPGGRIGDKTEAYFTLNSNLGVNNLFGTGIYSSLKISNLLDKKYQIPASTLNSWAEKGNPGYGRMFLLNLGYNF